METVPSIIFTAAQSMKEVRRARRRCKQQHASFPEMLDQQLKASSLDYQQHCSQQQQQLGKHLRVKTEIGHEKEAVSCTSLG
jgi:hypothetical protein